MKQRSPIAVFFLPFITFGIYGLVWSVKTKNEMNKLGANIPTAWLIIIPFINYYWWWKYCEGVENVTGGNLSGVMAFVLVILLGSIGMAIIQDSFNKASNTPIVAGGNFASPLSGTPQPDNSFGGPVAPTATPTPPQPNLVSEQPVSPPMPQPGSAVPSSQSVGGNIDGVAPITQPDSDQDSTTPTPPIS